MRRPALIHRRAQSRCVRVRDFGRPIATRAAAVNTDPIGVQTRTARDVIEYSVPQTLAVFRTGERRIRHPGHVDGQRRETGSEIGIARAFFFKGIDAAPDNDNRGLDNSLGFSQQTDGYLSFPRSPIKRHLDPFERWIEIMRCLVKIFL